MISSPPSNSLSNIPKVWKGPILPVASLLVVAGTIFFVTAVSKAPTESVPLSREQVCFKEHCFSVELAVTPEAQGQGLMFREHLPEDQGMLFVFDRETGYAFWMKNTLISLDIIWIDSESRVVYIHQNSKPCGEEECQVLKPNRKAKYVLELNGGTVGKIGLKVGDQLDLLID